MKLLLALLLVGLVAIGIGCKSKEEQARAVQEELARIKQEWKNGVNEYNTDGNRKLFVGFRVTVLKRLLNQASSGAIQSEFERICVTNITEFPADQDNLDKCYDAVLLKTLAVRSIDAKDRTRLLALLTRNCPDEGEHMMPLEFYCADQWPPAILVLFDAYEQTNSKVVKEKLMLHLGRAFYTLRNQNADDAAFLKAARKWFSENQSKLKINNEYPYLAGQPPRPVDSPKDLFLLVP